MLAGNMSDAAMLLSAELQDVSMQSTESLDMITQLVTCYISLKQYADAMLVCENDRVYK